MQDRKFVFLYLNTGGGHRSNARVVKDIFAKNYPDVPVTLVNAFDKRNYFGKVAMEDFYHYSLALAPGAYSYVYRTSKTKSQQLLSYLLMPHTERYLRKVFKEEKPTDIVVFHFALIHSALRLAKEIGPHVNVRVLVLDPYTPHYSWFYRKEAHYYVFSQKAKDFAVNKCGIDGNNINIVPFILGEKYRIPFTQDEVKALRQKYNLPENKKMVLLTGGAEGLPLTSKIVNEFHKRNVDFTVVAVCGRNVTSKAYLDHLAKNTNIDLRVYGFINFMDELVKCCDCAVIKAGPASMMEVLACRKPVVLSHFIYGQELGNVDYCIENKLGVYRNSPESICDAVNEMLSDQNYLDQLQKNFDSVDLNVNCDVISTMLMDRV